MLYMGQIIGRYTPRGSAYYVHLLPPSLLSQGRFSNTFCLTLWLLGSSWPLPLGCDLSNTGTMISSHCLYCIIALPWSQGTCVGRVKSEHMPVSVLKQGMAGIFIHHRLDIADYYVHRSPMSYQDMFQVKIRISLKTVHLLLQSGDLCRKEWPCPGQVCIFILHCF